MIKVTHIITGLSTGGAEMMLYKLLAATDRSRFEPTVISLAGCGTLGQRIEALGVKVHSVGMAPGIKLPAALLRLMRLARGLQPDLIQGWMYHGNLAATLCGRMVPGYVPVLWNIRHTPYDLKNEKPGTAAVIRLGARLSSRPERIIYNARASAQQHDLLGYAAHKVAVIPNGFDCDTFKPSESARWKIRRELGLDGQALLVGLIARYHPIKDHANFIRAAGTLAERLPEVNFVLAGRDVDKKNPALLDEIRKAGVASRTYLLGERADIPEITAALDLASSSSWGEAFPNVIGEAMACGVPCVVTNVGDSAWIVGETGIVVPPRDPAAWAKAWETLIKAGVAERRRLGVASRQRIADYFSLPKIVARYEELYEAVLSG